MPLGSWGSVTGWKDLSAERKADYEGRRLEHGQPLTAFFSSAPGLNFAAVFAAICIDSPV
jgi:hypothetical protein